MQKKAYKKYGKIVRVWLQKGPNMIFQTFEQFASPVGNVVSVEIL